MARPAGEGALRPWALALSAALALALAVPFEPPASSATDSECELLSAGSERDACYVRSALHAAIQARDDPENAPTYLATALRLCNSAAGAGAGLGGAATREACHASVAVELAPRLWGESADACAALGGFARDGCLAGVALAAPRSERSFSAALCGRVSNASQGEGCLRSLGQGDGLCEPSLGEGCAAQPADCPCPEGGVCAPGREGADGRGCARPSCGDGACDAPLESPGGCCADCGCPEGLRCAAGSCSAADGPAPAPTAASPSPASPAAGSSFVHPGAAEEGKPCLMGSECASGLCREGECAFLSDGDACTSNAQCASFNCRRSICCPFGRECCEGDGDCQGEDSECDLDAHACIVYQPGEKGVRQGMTAVGFVLLLVASAITVVAMKVALVGASRWLASAGARPDAPRVYMCERCGRRVATRGSLCVECHKGLRYVYGGGHI